MTVSSLENLASMDVAGRIGRVRGRLDDAACDALIVRKQENVRYLTGFSGSAGTLVVTGEASLLVTDGRYRDQAHTQIGINGVESSVEIFSANNGSDVIATFLSGVERVGLEDSTRWSEVRRFKERLSGAHVVPTSGVVEALRVEKDEGELARIEAACDIADIALAQVKSRLAERPTESDFAAELEYEMHRRGSSAPSFETIVASGPNSAMPHARPTNREISEGDLVVIDFGATVDGYHSDMTRTLCIGKVDNELTKLVDAVFAAQRAGVVAVEAGASGSQIDGACRQVLSDAGLGELFLHSTGHGVGLEIHEAPWVAPTSTDILPAGTVVTVEPGAYLARRGGVRIEDTVVVTAAGARILTKSTKDYTL